MDYYCNFSFLNQTSVERLSYHRTKIRTIHQALLPKCFVEGHGIIFCDRAALCIAAIGN